MKKVKIVYNPYLLTTNITVDGKKPAANSSLGFYKQRLQEWAEKLPKILLDEYRDNTYTIEFTGNLDDFEYLKDIINRHTIFTNFVLHIKPDVIEIEDNLEQILLEIKNGPINALLSPDSEYFIKSKLQSEIKVIFLSPSIATGKTTLINALLGCELIPLALFGRIPISFAIHSSSQDGYEGYGYDVNGKELYHEQNVTAQQIDKWCKNSNISLIEIYGPINCINPFSVNLTFIENSLGRSPETDYALITDSNSLLIYVLSGTFLGSHDYYDGLDFIAHYRGTGNKQVMDNLLFAVTKLDNYNPRDEDHIAEALIYVKDLVKELGIVDSFIFPLSALTALEIKTNPDDPCCVDSFRLRCRKWEEFHFENYFDYNKIPSTYAKHLEDEINIQNSQDDLLLHTGIPTLQAAIRFYAKHQREITMREIIDFLIKQLDEFYTSRISTYSPHLDNEQLQEQQDKLNWLHYIARRIKNLIYY